MSDRTYWVKCPLCGNEKFIKRRKDTVLIEYPAYCKKCKKEILINLEPRAEAMCFRT